MAVEIIKEINWVNFHPEKRKYVIRIMSTELEIGIESLYWFIFYFPIREYHRFLFNNKHKDV
jgi:hypothetical protein